MCLREMETHTFAYISFWYPTHKEITGSFAVLVGTLAGRRAASYIRYTCMYVCIIIRKQPKGNKLCTRLANEVKQL